MRGKTFKVLSDSILEAIGCSHVWLQQGSRCGSKHGTFNARGNERGSSHFQSLMLRFVASLCVERPGQAE